MGARVEGRPVPKLTLRVGVAGATTLENEARLEVHTRDALEKIDAACAWVCEEYYKEMGSGGAEGFICHLITSLADGADSLAARSRPNQYQLHVILPFDLANYRALQKDPSNLKDLLTGAARVFEMDGTSADGDAGLRRVSKMMVEHSDLLLLIGDPAGDGEITRLGAEDAAKLSIPRIRVTADGWSLVPGSTTCSDLVETVRRILLPLRTPSTPAFPDGGRFENRFKNLTDIAGSEQEWRERWPLSPEPGIQVVEAAFRKYWLWADHRANSYAELHRGAYRMLAFFAAAAVACALAGIVNQGLSVPGKIVELVILFLASLLWWRARHYRWRERWLNYRLLEQMLSHSATGALLGQVVRPPVDHHTRAFHRDTAFGDWFLRSVVREAGITSAKADPTYLRAVRSLIQEGVVKKQQAYYQKKAHENRDIDHQLERSSETLLLVTLAVTLVYLIMQAVFYYGGVAADCVQSVAFQIATIVGAGFPACAAVVASIRAHGEHLQFATRYEGMRDMLSGIQEDLESQELSLAGLAEFWSLVSQAELGEVQDWRVLLHTKPLER